VGEHSAKYLEYVLHTWFGAEWDAKNPDQQAVISDHFAVMVADPGPHGYDPAAHDDANAVAHEMRRRFGHGALADYAESCHAWRERERERAKLAEARRDEQVSPDKVACTHPGCATIHVVTEECDEAWDEAVRFRRWLPTDPADPTCTDLLCPEHRATGAVMGLAWPFTPPATSTGSA
jgi:hypothetical protein